MREPVYVAPTSDSAIDADKLATLARRMTREDRSVYVAVLPAELASGDRGAALAAAIARRGPRGTYGVLVGPRMWAVTTNPRVTWRELRAILKATFPARDGKVDDALVEFAALAAKATVVRGFTIPRGDESTAAAGRSGNGRFSGLVLAVALLSATGLLLLAVARKAGLKRGRTQRFGRRRAVSSRAAGLDGAPHGAAARGVRARRRERGHRYRLLLRYAKPYRRGWALIFVVTLLSTAFGVLGPLPMKVLVDNVLADKPLGLASFLPGAGSAETLLLWVVAAGLVFFALGALFDVLLTYLWVRVGQAMVYDLARDLFARIQRRSLLYHTRTRVGDSMTRVTDDSWCVHTVVDQLVFTPGHAVVTTVGVAFVMAQLNPFLTLLTLVVLPLMVASSVLLGRPIRRAAKRLRQSEVDIQSHVQQTLAGIPVVQAFAQEHRHHHRFQELARSAIRSQIRGAWVGSLNGLSSGVITTVGTSVILLVGARAVVSGTLTVGGLLAFMAYVGSLHQQIGGLTGIYTNLQGARASIDRVIEVLDAPPEIGDRADAVELPPVRGHVRIHDVHFSYDAEREVLRGVSLEAHPGEVVALVGATGAGKTTLASLIPRFFDPTAGRVTIDGHDVRAVTVESLRRQVALVLQEPFLFPATIAENIAYGRPSATWEEIVAAARVANAHSFISDLPEHYWTILGDRGATLSGGERQRLAIARAVLKDAPILILDEPTSALDVETEQLLLEALERLMLGRTTFIIAHRLSTIRNADRIVVLADGGVVETGTHGELVAHGGAFARLRRLQVAPGEQPAAAAGGTP